MKSRVFLASLLAGAIGMCGLTAGEQPRPSKSDDLEKANQLREEKTQRVLAGLADRGCDGDALDWPFGQRQKFPTLGFASSAKSQ